MSKKSEIVGPGFFIFFQHLTDCGGGGPPGKGVKYLPKKTEEDIQRQIREEDILILKVLQKYYNRL